MKNTIFISAFVILVSCGERNNSISTDQTTTSQLDTLMADDYVLTFENTDSFPETDIYGDLDYRNKLTDTIYNASESALKIQSYLSSKFGQYFHATNSALVVKLANGKTKKFSNVNDDEGSTSIHYYFEHYFNKIDYYLISVHLYEGGYQLLVNRKNGFTKAIEGLPYISNDNKKIMCVNADLESSYTVNGIELYTILADSLQTEFIRPISQWGPADMKWINENQLLIKRYFLEVDSITGNNIIDYKKVTIKKKPSA
jgi:hypothetical protein